MKQRAFSILAFLMLFLVMFYYLNKVFLTNNLFITTTEDFIDLANKSDIDLIFYGSSHSYTAYNPLIFNKVCNTISFNLGSHAQRLDIADLVLEESFKHASPKLVVLEVYRGTVERPTEKNFKAFQLDGLDFVSNLSINKLSRIPSIYNPNEYLGTLFPLIRNHNKWKTLSFFNLNRRDTIIKKWSFIYGGFVGAEKLLDSELVKKYQDFSTIKTWNDSSKKLVNTKAREYLKNFISLARSHGAKVLIVSSPELAARSTNYAFFSELESFCSNLNVGFLNLNDFYEEMGLAVNDFKDPSHLNNFGAIKTSFFLRAYINNNYKLRDRSSEGTWKQTMNDYIEFEDTYIDFKKIFKRNVNSPLIKNIVLENIEILKEVNTYSISIDFIKNKMLAKELINYNISINIIPDKSEINNISAASKSKNWTYDKFDFNLEDSDESFKREIFTKIKNIHCIEIFLYNKEKYTGRIGNKIVIDSIILQSKNNLELKKIYNYLK